MERPPILSVNRVTDACDNPGGEPVPSLPTPPSTRAVLVGGPGYGTQIDFRLYPALRLRLRAGL